MSSEHPALSRAPVRIALITVDPAAGDRFVESVCGPHQTEFIADDERICITARVYRSSDENKICGALNEADAVALLVSHIDAVSIEHLRAAYRLLPSEYTLPAAILVVREPGRMEFKMSCPTCGQKLWVRDEDKGRNGRCPHCKKSFVLPSQTAHLKSVLMTPEIVPIVTVTDGHATNCRGPIAALAERARRHAQALKSATMRVQVTDAPPAADPADEPGPPSPS